MEAPIDRFIAYDQSQTRAYDVLQGAREALRALGDQSGHAFGTTASVVAGLGATSNSSMTITLAAGAVYSLTNVDTTAYGDLTSDTSQTIQQGFAAAQSVILSTSGISSGQSRYTLIHATFSQTDDIPSDDPNAGVLNYLNATDPTQPPWSGPANSGVAQNTRRRGVCTISTTNGAPATTGSETPPNAPGGAVPLYLVDLAFGQSVITQNQILVAGPSAGTNVPSNYTAAPFLAGLTQKPTISSNAGNPNASIPGIVLGTTGTLYWPNLIWDTTNSLLWICTTSGPAASAVWVAAGPQRTFAGPTLKLSASLSSAATSVAFTADEIGVATALGGAGTTVASFSKTLNVSTTGANAMDVGQAPVSGFLSIYAIYNQTTGTAAVLGTTASSGTIYGGANMPSGYTMSALLAIWPTNASRQLIAGNIIDREFYYTVANAVLTNGAATSSTGISLSSFVPSAARGVYGWWAGDETSVVNVSSFAGFSTLQVTTTNSGNANVYASIPILGGLAGFNAWIPINTAQTVYYNVGQASFLATARVLGYRI